MERAKSHLKQPKSSSSSIKSYSNPTGSDLDNFTDRTQLTDHRSHSKDVIRNLLHPTGLYKELTEIVWTYYNPAGTRLLFFSHLGIRCHTQDQYLETSKVGCYDLFSRGFLSPPFFLPMKLRVLSAGTIHWPKNFDELIFFVEGSTSTSCCGRPSEVFELLYLSRTGKWIVMSKTKRMVHMSSRHSFQNYKFFVDNDRLFFSSYKYEKSKFRENRYRINLCEVSKQEDHDPYHLKKLTL